MKQRIIAGGTAAFLLVGGVALAVIAAAATTTPPPTTTTTTTTTVPDDHDHHGARRRWRRSPGCPELRRPGSIAPALVVKIDNGEPKARPQVGINQADVVYEERVEGSVTRLLAIFHSTDSVPVGPVRSARTSDIAIVTPLNRPFFAWSGANATFAGAIRGAAVQDVGYDALPSEYYREQSRSAPSNLMLKSTATIYGPAQRGVGAAAAAVPVPDAGSAGRPPRAGRRRHGGLRSERRAARPPSGGGTATAGPAARRARRTSTAAGVQVAPANVIIQFVEYEPSDVADQFGVPIPEAQLVGEGDVWVLTGGGTSPPGLVQGRWKKTSLEAVTTYTDADGKPILLRARPHLGRASRRRAAPRGSRPPIPSSGSERAGRYDRTMADAAPRPLTHDTGTTRVKRGLAEMLKGGVIMDVVDPEQAKIAEDAGAVAVMALERVPSDIRRDGGVARMSDPEMIEGIKAAVTIPVMAKARIGHFVEAQILEALGVDYVDESEVLTPADEAHHIDKWAFTVPFVCGATNLGEALRRISEGAAHDPLQGRGRHRQRRRGRAPPALDPRRHPQDHPGRLGRAVRLGQAAAGAASASCRSSPRPASCPCRCSAPAASPPRPTPPSSCSSAPRPCSSARASSRATTPPGGPRPSSRPPPTSTTPTSSPRCRRGLGAAMPGLEIGTLETKLRRPRAGSIGHVLSEAPR